MDASDTFHVETVESLKTSADPGTWCRYVIANRTSRVVGKYRGTLAQTRRNAEQLAESINERARSGTSAWSPSARNRKAPRRPSASA